jgi:hypothetical protein
MNLTTIDDERWEKWQRDNRAWWAAESAYFDLRNRRRKAGLAVLLTGAVLLLLALAGAVALA